MNGVFQVSHDIKGQGGSFGYDLMTAIGNELCRFIEKADKVGAGEIAAIKLHIDALKMVIAQDLKGTGERKARKCCPAFNRFATSFWFNKTVILSNRPNGFSRFF